MRLMHTPLPVYVAKMHDAAGGKALTIKGIEGWESAKCASVKTGRIEEAIKIWPLMRAYAA